MCAETMVEGGQADRHGLWHLPSGAAGWWALFLTLAIWPVAWTLMTHAIDWPVLDTWVAPLLLAVLIDVAAAFSLVAMVRKKDRSFLVILAAAFSLPLAVFATIFLAMHAVFPD